LSGNADFMAPGGPGGIVAIAHHQNPGKLKVYSLAAESKERIGTALVVRKESKIKSIENLNGKNIGIVPGIQFRTLGNHIINQANLNKEKTKLIDIPLGSQIQALGSKQVDAILTIEPIGTIAVKKGIARHLVKAPTATYVHDPWFGGAGAVNQNFAEKNPKKTEKIIKIFSRASEEVNNNLDKNKVYLPKYTPLNEELSKEIPILFFRDVEDLTNHDKEALKIFLDLFTEQDVIKGEIDIESLFYTG